MRFTGILIILFFDIVTFTTGNFVWEIFGDVGCTVMKVSYTFTSLHGLLATWGTCLFRFFLLVHPVKSLKIGFDQLKKSVLISQYSLLLLFFISSNSTSAMSRIDRFCDGNFREIDEGNKAKMFWLGFLQMIPISKLAMYIVIYIKVNKVNKSLTKEIIHKRKKKNVITLTGETLTFCVSMIFFTLINIVQNQNATIFVLKPEASAFHIIYGYALVSICQLISSPEMIRHFFKINV